MANVSIPDLLTDRARAEAVYNALQSLQLDELNNGLAQTRAGGADKPSGHYEEDGTAISFADRGKEIAQQIKALSEQHQDLLPEVKKIHAERNPE